MSDNPYSHPLPCPLWTHTALLRPVAVWTLDSFGEDPPMLVGVELATPSVKFHPVYLDEADPLDTMSGLVAPDSWDLLSVVVEAHDAGGRLHNGVLAHVIDRAGRSATELDEWCGRRRSLRAFNGRLHDACTELFEI